MIKANELRIGNWVYDSVLKENVQLKNWHFLKEIYSDSYSFIPLTPEVLEKCGFTTVTTNSDGSYNMWGKELDASIDIEEGEVYKYRIHERERTKHIMYLHQLQNLYFALTGEELTFNL